MDQKQLKTGESENASVFFFYIQNQWSPTSAPKRKIEKN